MHKLYHILERSSKESRCKILEFAPSFQKKKKRSSSLIAFNAKPDATSSDIVISNLQLELDVRYGSKFDVSSTGPNMQENSQFSL